MAGQGLRMNVNGRLTAPPQVEAVLATNSVDGIVSKGRIEWPGARGTTLGHIFLDTGLRMRTLRSDLQVEQRCAGTGGRGLWKSDPVSATHGLSASREAAAGI